MKGILAVNHFLSTQKFNTLHRYLLESAEKCGIELVLKTNLELALEIPSADFVLFGIRILTLPHGLKRKDFPF